MLRLALAWLPLIITLGLPDAVLSRVALQGESPVLAWPEAFTSQTSQIEWTERSVDIGSLRIRVSVPAKWTLRVGTPSSEPLVAMDMQSGRRLEIAETNPTTFSLDQPVSSERLQQSIQTMQAAAPHGYVVEKAGQVRIGERLWLWHESRVPAFDASILPSFKDMLRDVPYGSARTWSFIATAQSRLVRVYCTVMYPRDVSDREIDLRTREAGAVFAAILRRFVFEPQ